MAHGSTGTGHRRDRNPAFLAIYQPGEGNKVSIASSTPILTTFGQHSILNARKPAPFLCLDRFSNPWEINNDIASNVVDISASKVASTVYSFGFNYGKDFSLPTSGLNAQDTFQPTFKIEEDLNGVPAYIEDAAAGVGLGFVFPEQTVVPSNYNDSSKNEPSMDLVVSRRQQNDYLAWPSYGNYFSGIGPNIHSANPYGQSFIQSLPSSEDGHSDASQAGDNHGQEDQNDADYLEDVENHSKGIKKGSRKTSEALRCTKKSDDMDDIGEGDLPKDENGRALPYAKMIEMAFLSVPSRSMVLSEIYGWFRTNYPRFKAVKGRGWMNSIRHNLSMNGGFEKRPRPDGDTGKGHVWVLTDQAQREGVKSTTRFRQKASNKRTAKHMSSSIGKSGSNSGDPPGSFDQFGKSKKLKLTSPSRGTRPSFSNNLQGPTDSMNMVPSPLMRSYSSNGETSPESVFPHTPEPDPLGFAANGSFISNGPSFYPHIYAPHYEHNINIVPSQNEFSEVGRIWELPGEKWTS